MSRWILASEFARLEGVSRSAITQRVNNGTIAPQHVRRDGTRLRVNTAALTGGLPSLAWCKVARQAATAQPIESLDDDVLDGALEPINRWIEARDQAPEWDAVAERLNDYLGEGWPAPPWDADQVATLALCIELAEEGAE